MTTYGVTPAGFVRKPLADVLTEVQERNVATFGPQTIQTSQSPLGQLNGLFADVLATVWEHIEDAYQSIDVDEAEGARLIQLAKLRLLAPVPGESDIAFRRAITNVDRARIDISDLIWALRGLDGVTFAHVYVNDSASVDANGIPPQHVSVAVIGGQESAISELIHNYVVPGIGTFGNVVSETLIRGFCRPINILRPAVVNLELEIDIRVNDIGDSCPPPSTLAMAAGLAEAMSGVDRPRNGQDITDYIIRRLIEPKYPGVEVVEVRAAIMPAAVAPAPLSISFSQIAAVTAENITFFTVA